MGTLKWAVISQDARPREEEVVYRIQAPGGILLPTSHGPGGSPQGARAGSLGPRHSTHFPALLRGLGSCPRGGPDARTEALAGAQVLSGQENIGDKNYEETCKRKQNRVHFLVVYWVKSFLAQSADSSAHGPICREQRKEG